ncbi:MAG: hypothetical protein ABIP80_05110 [Ferruginibacter sp.]
MIFKRDDIKLGIILGILAPVVGLVIFILYKLGNLSIPEGFQFLLVEPGLRTFSAALSLSLILNAVLFTLYINNTKDLTAKGIFFATLIYGAVILVIKTIY